MCSHCALFASSANGDNAMIPSILEVDESENQDEDVEILRSSIPYVIVLLPTYYITLYENNLLTIYIMLIIVKLDLTDVDFFANVDMFFAQLSFPCTYSNTQIIYFKMGYLSTIDRIIGDCKARNFRRFRNFRMIKHNGITFEMFSIK